MRCRICGSKENLKFTQAQIKGSQSKSKKNNFLPLPFKELANALNGNICKICDMRLQNFHHEENDSLEVQGNINEVPIFVDDDERLYNIFYKKHGTMEAGITGSLGSDGDPEVIEVLTSRETSPDIGQNYNNNEDMHARIPSDKKTRIVDVIELEDDEDVADEIVETVNNSNSKVQINQQGETRLLGCLSLVTSDSDSEINFEPCRKIVSKKDKNSKTLCSEEIEQKLQPEKNDFNSTSSLTIQHTFPVCQVCGTRFLDTKSLEVHSQEHERRFACPVCESQFSVDLDLVYHVRKKHRLYDGNMLCEGARCSQDSAMTIRLRFEQSLTFYECQLCGMIDSQFKLHKEHIMQNHADESKSLRDPMMKAKPKCPACLQKIGTHNVDVCRHLLSKHTEAYARYVTEIKDLHLLGVSNKTLQKIQYSARVLSLVDSEEQFFECQLCQRIFGTIRTFLHHLNGHNIDEWTQYKERKSSTMVAQVDQKTRLKRKTEEHQLKNLDQKQINLTEGISKEKNNNKHANKSCLKPEDTKLKKEERMFKKPLKPVNTGVEEAINYKNESKPHKKLKRRSKTDAPSTKGVIKVKVKTPIRHFPTQKYKCQHCQKTFKGFRKLHLHLLFSHRVEEFKSCNYCKLAFASETALTKHCQNWHSETFISTSKRKRKQNATIARNCHAPHDDNEQQVDENFNKEDCTKHHRLGQLNYDSGINQKQQFENSPEPIWLKELYQLSREKKKKESYLYTASQDKFLDNIDNNSDKEQLNKSADALCRYCARLISAPLDLSAHEKMHVLSKDMPWIQFSHLG